MQGPACEFDRLPGLSKAFAQAMERKPWFTPEEFAKYSVASDLHKIPGKIASAMPAAQASSSSAAPATWQTPPPAAPQLAQAAMVSNALSQINQIQTQLYQSLGLSPQPQQQLPQAQKAAEASASNKLSRPAKAEEDEMVAPGGAGDEAACVAAHAETSSAYAEAAVLLGALPERAVGVWEAPLYRQAAGACIDVDVARGRRAAAAGEATRLVGGSDAATRSPTTRTSTPTRPLPKRRPPRKREAAAEAAAVPPAQQRRRQRRRRWRRGPTRRCLRTTR